MFLIKSLEKKWKLLWKNRILWERRDEERTSDTEIKSQQIGSNTEYLSLKRKKRISTLEERRENYPKTKEKKEVWKDRAEWEDLTYIKLEFQKERTEAIFENIMAKNLPELMKNINLQNKNTQKFVNIKNKIHT